MPADTPPAPDAALLCEKLKGLAAEDTIQAAFERADLVFDNLPIILAALRALGRVRGLVEQWRAEIRSPDALEWYMADFLDGCANELAAILDGKETT